uniref:Uncharacterized protein n=1 Tax=Tetradesmus obliquus TaxID=3088 RepID=A0A383VN01_TETOB|eukprot:jgi/Sobl393_1/13961/SZX66908.1
MKPQFASLMISTGSDSPCSEHGQMAFLQGSSGSSPNQWEQGSSCSSASSKGSWQLDAAAPTELQQPSCSKYSKLRVSIPGGSECDTAGSSPAQGLCPGSCPAAVAGASCASTPGSCPGLGVPALLAGNRLALAGRQGFCAADELYLRQQGGCLSSSSSAAARRLLASQADDSEDVAAWLEQQISMRQGARGASCNIDGPGTPEIAGVEVLGAAVGGCSNSRGLPRPAFQLLGLL